MNRSKSKVMSNSNQNSSRCVLLVDDEPDLLQVMGEYFELKGWVVLTATSSKQAMAILNGLQVDAVVADVYLGPASGLDLLRSIREKLKKVPPLFLLSGEFSLKQEEVVGMGAQALFNKPMSAKALVEAVQQSIDNPTPVQSLDIDE